MTTKRRFSHIGLVPHLYCLRFPDDVTIYHWLRQRRNKCDASTCEVIINSSDIRFIQGWSCKKIKNAPYIVNSLRPNDAYMQGERRSQRNNSHVTELNFQEDSGSSSRLDNHESVISIPPLKHSIKMLCRDSYFMYISVHCMHLTFPAGDVFIGIHT